MNIGFDFRMGGAKHGGIGRYAEELLFAMLAQDKTDTFFIFFNDSLEGSIKEKLSIIHNAKLVYVKARHYSLLEQIELPWVLKNLPVDIVFYPNFNHPVFSSKKFVVTIHDMVHHRISGHKLKTKLYFYGYKYIMRHACTAAEKIITPSHASKAEVEAIFPKSQDHVEVIYEGISLKPVSSQTVTKVKENFLLDKPYFLFVGTLERKKNILGLAKGFSRLLEKHKLDVDFVFAGKVDKHYPDIKHQVLELPSNKHFIFTGFISDEELAALYQGAHLYASASDNEGFGLPGVEAMQFGLPLVVSNSPVYNEIYDDAAVYFDQHNPEDIAEKLYLLATDKKYYDLKSKAAAERSQYFSWEKTALETLAVLRSSAGLPGVIANESSELEFENQTS